MSECCNIVVLEQTTKTIKLLTEIDNGFGKSTKVLCESKLLHARTFPLVLIFNIFFRRRGFCPDIQQLIFWLWRTRRLDEILLNLLKDSQWEESHHKEGCGQRRGDCEHLRERGVEEPHC